MMNKRIKELWNQSQTRQEVETFSEGVFHTRVTDNYEKFAELIVQECAKIVNDNDFAGSTMGNRLLFEHFGIKE